MLSLTLLTLAACEPDAGVTVYTTPPTASITTPPDGSGFEEGEIVTFQGVVDDAQDVEQDLTTIWASDIDGDLYSGLGADADGLVEFVTGNLSPGNHLITLTVVDSDAEKGTDDVEISISDLPDDPVIELLRPTGNDYGVEGETFTFKAQVSDEQDPPGYLTVSMSSSFDGEFCTPAPAADGLVVCDEELSVQETEHILTYTVTDSEGYTGNATAYFLVYAGTAVDNDGDNFSEDQGDCDDEDPDIYPGAEEVLNYEDDDCDTIVDEGTANYDDDEDGQTELEGDCDDNDPHSYKGGTETCDGADNDCDTWTEEDGDCDDTNSNVNPSEVEVCDGIDNNCTDGTDEENATGCDTWYVDSDGDGYGSSVIPGKCYCDATGSYTVDNSSDCYDSNNKASPIQTSYFDVDRGDGSFDYDCSGKEDKEYTDSYSCTLLCLAPATDGWINANPACGNSASYGEDCWLLSSDLCEPGSTSSKTQTCR